MNGEMDENDYDDAALRLDCCKHCKFWEFEEGICHVNNEGDPGYLSGYGWCKRFPPNFKEGEGPDQFFNQPLARYHDWCGEFKKKGTP